MKDLRTFDNDSIITHGDEIVGCTMDHDEDIITTTETLSTTSPDTAEVGCCTCIDSFINKKIKNKMSKRQQPIPYL